MLWKRTPTTIRFLLHELKGALFHIWYFYWASSDATGVAFPSAKTISKFTGYSTKVVMQARSELVKGGWLCPIQGQQRNGYRFGPKYFLVLIPEREIIVGKKATYDQEGRKFP
jgi:Helix-turn-helix domain